MNSVRWSFIATLISSLLLLTNASARDYEKSPIIGGNETAPGDFSYVVGINCNRRRCRCTGSIIDERFVVSAAHCFVDGQVEFGYHPVRITAGSNDVSDKTNPRRVEINVEKIYVPDSYKDTYTDDIAVLKLKRSLKLKENKLQKVRVPTKTHSRHAGKRAILLGFGVSEITYTVTRQGDTIETNHPNSKLHSANVLLVANDKCNDKLVEGSNLCGKIIKNKATKHFGGCSGDSGGPLVYKSKVLIGIFIQGPLTCNERSDYGIYTRVTSHVSFIERAMKDDTTGMIFKTYD